MSGSILFLDGHLLKPCLCIILTPNFAYVHCSFLHAYGKKQYHYALNVCIELQNIEMGCYVRFLVSFMFTLYGVYIIKITQTHIRFNI